MENQSNKKSVNQYFEFFKNVPLSLIRRVKILVPLLSISGILEVASLAILIPLISMVLQPSDKSIIVDLFGISSFSDAQKLIIVFSIFIVIIVLKGIFVFLVSKFTFATALKIKVSLQNKLFNKYLKKNFISHLDSNSANYLRNITTECHQIEGRLIMPGLTLLAEILPVLFIISFLIYLNPFGVFVAFVIFLLAGVLITKFTNSSLKRYGKEQIESDGMQIKIAKEAFSSLKEISLYKKEKKISDIYNSYTNKSANLIANALALGQIPKFILEVIGLLTISLIAYISFTKGATPNEVLIELAVFMAAIVKLLPSANRIVMNLQSLAHAKPAIENILKELKTFEDSKAQEDVVLMSKLKNIEFNNLCFKYPKSNDYVLQNINLKINSGEIIGIKGESGSGKSTLINLILGLFESTNGNILINNTDIKKCVSSWQDKISYVPQDVVLFDDTLRNNIVFYQDSIPDDEVINILRKIKLDIFIEKLDMSIGEGGSSLSGGQKQRIGIARALVRNPEFIIFDEATSALDTETEQKINELIREISLSTTVFIIAHKRSALEVCDRVYKIQNNNLIKEEI